MNPAKENKELQDPLLYKNITIKFFERANKTYFGTILE